MKWCACRFWLSTTIPSFSACLLNKLKQLKMRGALRAVEFQFTICADIMHFVLSFTVEQPVGSKDVNEGPGERKSFTSQEGVNYLIKGIKWNS
jgi:hypothetical protein